MVKPFEITHALEVLEYEDQNNLSGSVASRSLDRQEMLDRAIKIIATVQTGQS